MRGFLISLEAVLALYILVIFILHLFLPLLDVSAVLSFLEKNDQVSVEMDAYGRVLSFSHDEENCVFTRYYYDSGRLFSVCIR